MLSIKKSVFCATTLILLTACASAPKQSINQKILTCNYAQELESIDDVPVPKDESVTDYAKRLQNWAADVIYMNKRNVQLRKSTTNCINNVLKNQ